MDTLCLTSQYFDWCFTCGQSRCGSTVKGLLGSAQLMCGTYTVKGVLRVCCCCYYYHHDDDDDDDDDDDVYIDGS